MKKIAIIMTALLLCFAQAGLAATERSRQLAEELLVTNNVRQQLDRLYAQMREMLNGQFAALDISAEDQADVQELQRITTDILFENLGWESLKGEYIELYASTFSEQELEDILAFAKSPLGRKLNEKTPILMQKGMEIGQRRAMAVMPKVQAAIEAHISKQKAAQ